MSAKGAGAAVGQERAATPRRCEHPDEYLGLRLAGLRGDVQELSRDVLGDVGLAAVLTHLGGNLVHHHCLAVAMEGYGRRSRPGLSVMANDAVHRVFLRVLKSGSHSAGSGR